MRCELDRVKLLLAALIVVVAGVTNSDAHPGSGIVVDRLGRVYFLDTGGGVWLIETNGKLVHHSDPRFHWMAIDESERRPGTPLPSIAGGEITAVGNNPTLLLSSDVPIAIGRNGALYYPEMGQDRRLRIMQMTRAGVRSVFALLPNSADRTALRWINGLAAGQDGVIYYTEDKAVRRINQRGVVSTVAENISLRDCTSIPGIESGSRPYLRGLAARADGTLIVAASGCGAVFEITQRGRITALLRTSSPWSPTAVALAPSGIYRGGGSAGVGTASAKDSPERKRRRRCGRTAQRVTSPERTGAG